METKSTISTPVLVLNEIVKSMESRIQGLNYVYDEELSHETSVTSYKNNLTADKSDDRVYPLLGFKRSILTQSERAIAKRASQQSLRHTALLASEGTQFANSFASFVFEFNLYTKSMIDLEQFEVSFLAERGLFSIKNVEVDLKEFGKFTYSLKDHELTDKTFQIESTYYKLLSGQIVVEGSYPIITGTQSVIKSIFSDIHSCLGTEPELLSSIIIEES
jgi:DNA-binding transcriptional ArsR family regulator